MDEGLPIAYLLLDENVPVYAAGGERVGSVDHVVADGALDIFHGIVIRVGDERRFVAAEQVDSLHERGVDLSIDAAGAAALPAPEGAAPVWRDAEPGVRPSAWSHFVDRLTGRAHRDGWVQEDEE